LDDHARAPLALLKDGRGLEGKATAQRAVGRRTAKLSAANETRHLQIQCQMTVVSFQYLGRFGRQKGKALAYKKSK